MPETHVVTAVDSNPPHAWTSSQGKAMLDYKIQTDVGGETVYEQTRLATSPAPAVGDSFEADVQAPNKEGYPPKLKRVSSGGGGGYGGSSRAVSPDERRSIERQVAAKCTAEMLASVGGTDPFKLGGAFAELFAVVDQCIRGDA